MPKYLRENLNGNEVNCLPVPNSSQSSKRALLKRSKAKDPMATGTPNQSASRTKRFQSRRVRKPDATAVVPISRPTAGAKLIRQPKTIAHATPAIVNAKRGVVPD